MSSYPSLLHRFCLLAQGGVSLGLIAFFAGFGVAASGSLFVVGKLRGWARRSAVMAATALVSFGLLNSASETGLVETSVFAGLATAGSSAFLGFLKHQAAQQT